MPPILGEAVGAGMYPIVQVIFGGLAVFVVWTLFRAGRSGFIFSKGIEFTLYEQPIVFSLVFSVHLIIAALCIWIAAGYDPGEFFQALGISAN